MYSKGQPGVFIEPQRKWTMSAFAKYSFVGLYFQFLFLLVVFMNKTL